MPKFRHAVLKKAQLLRTALCVGATCLLVPLAALYAADTQRPNLLFLIADQHRGDFIGCAGHPFAQTPSLDRLASQGVRFERAYTSWPICVPARMSIITGRYPHSHGAYGDQAVLLQPTIADQLKALGYQTAAIGKMHFLDTDQHHGFDYRIEHEDFDKAIGESRRSHKVSSRDGKAFGVAKWPEEQTYEHFIADKAIAWLEKNGARPFVLWCSFSAPHPPYLAPEKLFNLYAGKVTLPPQTAVPNPLLKTDEHLGKLTAADVKTILACYLANITLTDLNLGRVLAALDRLGLGTNTVVCYTADHGDMQWQFQRFGKGVMFDGATRIPLILRAPTRVPVGVIRCEVVEHVDLYPTFCELLGVPVPPTVQGRSLLPLLAGTTTNWPNTAFIEQNRQVTIVHDRYKCSFAQDQPRVLYDLQTDPQEWTNLFSQPVSAPLLADMQKLLTDWRARTPDAASRSDKTMKNERKEKRTQRKADNQTTTPQQHTP